MRSGYEVKGEWKLSLVIPDELLQVSDMTAQELMQEIAIMLFQLEKISMGKAAEVSGMDQVSFQHLLASREIPMHYDVEDLEHDIETLRRLGRL
jgi:predicted HTH domain antitoxin